LATAWLAVVSLQVVPDSVHPALQEYIALAAIVVVSVHVCPLRVQPAGQL